MYKILTEKFKSCTFFLYFGLILNAIDVLVSSFVSTTKLILETFGTVIVSNWWWSAFCVFLFDDLRESWELGNAKELYLKDESWASWYGATALRTIPLIGRDDDLPAIADVHSE